MASTGPSKGSPAEFAQRERELVELRQTIAELQTEVVDFVGEAPDEVREEFLDELQMMREEAAAQKRRAGRPLIPTTGVMLRRIHSERLAAMARRPSGRAPRRATNTRRRGSRRVTRAGPSSSDDPPDESDSEPPGLGLWRHPRYGRCSPPLLRTLLAPWGAG